MSHGADDQRRARHEVMVSLVRPGSSGTARHEWDGPLWVRHPANSSRLGATLNSAPAASKPPPPMRMTSSPRSSDYDVVTIRAQPQEPHQVAVMVTTGVHAGQRLLGLSS